MLYFDIQNAYNFKSDRQDYLVRVEDAGGNPVTDPNNSGKYLLKTIKSSGGTVLPTIGIMVEFWENEGEMERLSDGEIEGLSDGEIEGWRAMC